MEFKVPPSKKLKLDHINPKQQDLDTTIHETDTNTIKKLLFTLEKSLSSNTLLRSKYSNNPLKFIDSEQALDDAISALTSISSSPELFPVLIQLNSHVSILSLLAHENTDIVLSTLTLINEFTDDDTVDQTTPKAAQGIKQLLHSWLDADILSLLVANLDRLLDDRADDRQGIFDTLSIMENFVSIDPELEVKVFNSIIPWILKRLSLKQFDSIIQYATELLAILLQSNKENKHKFISSGGLDSILLILARYRKKDPTDADEIEMLENLFDCVCALVQEPDLKLPFVQAEGIQLMFIFIKQKLLCRARAIKVIDHVLLGHSQEGAELFVELGGLKSVFSAFLKKGSAKYKKQYPEFSQKEEEEHIVSIICSLFKNLQSQDHKLRLIYKFIESDFEKLHQLLIYHTQYKLKVGLSMLKEDGTIEQDEDDELEYMNRLDAGLFTLQLIDIILMYCMHESPEIKRLVPTLLPELDETMENVGLIVKEYLDNYGVDSTDKDVLEHKKLLKSMLVVFDVSV
ncbi:Catenin-beta-like protein [Globomyces pollinis-pini]|nr:Catenin-beta-like protein [Globomyces pollinis-pini]